MKNLYKEIEQCVTQDNNDALRDILRQNKNIDLNNGDLFDLNPPLYRAATFGFNDVCETLMNIEEKIKLTITDYGIYVLSINKLLDFLRVRKIRSNKILSLFQNNHKLYLESLLEGVWIPITPIISTKYIINGTFQEEEWKECFEYKNFNLEITDNSYWVGSFGNLLSLNKKQFLENSSNNISYKTLDNINILSAIRFKLKNGLYHVNIKGYERKQHQDYPIANFGIKLEFKAIEEFIGYKDPRNDQEYTFFSY